jgi:GGDEF domain-containing protein
VAVRTSSLDTCASWIEFAPAARELLFDPLTGLPGPMLVLDRATIALARTRTSRRKVGVFVLRDACVAADPAAVRAIARALTVEVRPDDTVARTTSSTFVVICNEIRDENLAGRVLSRLLRRVDVGCRFGVALGDATEDARSVLARAARRANRPAVSAA